MKGLTTSTNSSPTEEPFLPLFAPYLTNCSSWDQRWGTPYLHRIAHLDVQFYHDFYTVWVCLMVSNCLMLLVGVALNSLALFVFCGASTHPSSSSCSSSSLVFTINLAVADLLVALSLPARIALYHSRGTCIACSYVHTFSYFVNMYCSILFLTSICIDRYLAVVHSSSTLHRWRTTGAARCVCAIVWVTAIVVTYSFQTTTLGFSSSCVLLPAHFYLTILEFLFPLLAVVGFTLRVTCFLSTNHGLMPQQSRARRTRAIRLLAAVLVVFTVCFTPFHLRQVLVYVRVRFAGAALGRGTEHVLAYHITVTLSSLNSCLDPVVYCFVTDSFRRMWRARWRRSRAREVEWEIRHTSGVDGERKPVRRCGAAMAIAHSVATLTVTGTAFRAEGNPPTGINTDIET
ncbi:G-protein coupled receptor 20-like [Gouania willdenowi]|uniref:G-protein coupled receptor 20-like n=1 Tax=Gouania willdenowi TaxID=441366 RepID=UPI0010557C7B|nr:G-protein coupled receptor 20-like [Gouania willdenowi]